MTTIDMRGACPMPAAECPDRCACPFDLWRWLRPRLLAERSVRIVERRKCEWCGRIRPLGKFWQPVACRYIWVCRECSGSGA
jgi:hypothetical protein